VNKTFFRPSRVSGWAVLLFLIALTVASENSPSSAQQGGYRISRSIIGSGAVYSAGPAYRMVGTLGQPFVGITRKSGTVHLVGFWYRGAETVTDVPTDLPAAAIPRNFRLEQNYPNPFNPSTTIRFAIARKVHVTLSIYNLVAQKMITLINREMIPGEYEIRFNAQDLPSGVYFFRLDAGTFSQTRKLILLK
jgi:hypothetical protein